MEKNRRTLALAFTQIGWNSLGASIKAVCSTTSRTALVSTEQKMEIVTREHGSMAKNMAVARKDNETGTSTLETGSTIKDMAKAKLP